MSHRCRPLPALPLTSGVGWGRSDTPQPPPIPPLPAPAASKFTVHSSRDIALLCSQHIGPPGLPLRCMRHPYNVSTPAASPLDRPALVIVMGGAKRQMWGPFPESCE